MRTELHIYTDQYISISWGDLAKYVSGIQPQNIHYKMAEILQNKATIF